MSTTNISELSELDKDFKKLSDSSFSLQEDFLQAFFDPIPKSILKWILLLFLVFTITNILAFTVLVIYYLTGPRRTRKSRPKKDSAKEWFLYAERCLKYDYTDEILEGYTKALELEPDNGQILLRYKQFLASEFVHNKVPVQGEPIGKISKKKSEDPYEEYKNLLNEWKTTHPEELFPNPIKPTKKEKIYSIGAWLAYDTKHYSDCVDLGEYSLQIDECSDSKKDTAEKLELYLLLSCALLTQGNITKGVDYLHQALEQSGQVKKDSQAMIWELAGEYFNSTKQTAVAEKCYLLAQKKDENRWISAYRLFRYYARLNDQKKSSLYKSRYMRMQRELSPL